MKSLQMQWKTKNERSQFRTKGVTSSHRGKPKEPLGVGSDESPSSLTVDCPSQTISYSASFFPHLLVMRNMVASWFWRIMLFVMMIVSGILHNSSIINLIFLFDRRISPSSCLLTDSSTRAISRVNMQRTGLWSLSVTSMQASYLANGRRWVFQILRRPFYTSKQHIHRRCACSRCTISMFTWTGVGPGSPHTHVVKIKSFDTNRKAIRFHPKWKLISLVCYVDVIKTWAW